MSRRLIAAAEVSHAERAALWNEAFSDYFAPASFTPESLAAFERAFDLDLGASQVAFEGERPVAFAMLGIRPTPAATAAAGGMSDLRPHGWVGGMGVVPSARQHGHGAGVMRGVLGAARERGLEVVRLEVLVQNAPAIPLYERLGFRTVRRLEVWDRAADAPAPAPPAPPAHPLPIDNARRFLDEARPERAPWQRELAPALAAFPDMQALASDQGDAAAILRATPERIAILEIAARPSPNDPMRERALDSVLATIFATFPGRAMRLLNLPEGDFAGAALARAGAAVSHRQWEMEVGA